MPPSRTLSSSPTEIVWTLPNSSFGQLDTAPGSTTTKHAKKKPATHIPRPPNAFILFRSSFIKSQHVSTDVETNHSTLSKIIGMTWQGMKDEERKVWHDKARVALEEHRKRFPAYAFRPSGGGAKGGTPDGGGGGVKRRKVREVEPKDTKRCQKIAELLVEGLKGATLDDAIREFDKTHVKEIVTRFEVPITESAYRKKEEKKAAQDVKVIVDVKKEPTVEEMVDQQLYYPDPANDYSYCHTPTSPYPNTPISSYPTSPIDHNSPVDMTSFPCSPSAHSSYPCSPAADNFFNPEFVGSCQLPYPPAPSYDTLSPPSYELDAPVPGFLPPPESVLDSFFSNASDTFTFEFPGAPDGEFLTDFMDFEMPMPLNPTWNINGEGSGLAF